MDKQDRWPITNQHKQEIVDRLLQIVKLGSDDLAVKAASALVVLEEQNLEYDFSFGDNFGGLDDEDEDWG